MRVVFHQNFKKQYQKLRREEQQKFKERRNLLLKNPFHPLLNNHALRGKYRNYRSINIGGDLRAIYEEIDSGVIQFILIDTHGNLYS